MKKSKFTEAQIAFCDQTVRDLYPRGGSLQKNGHQQGHILQLLKKI